MSKKTRWVVTGADLKTYNRVRSIVGWIAVFVFLPIVILVIIGTGADWVQRQLQKVVDFVTVWITCVVRRMWNAKLPQQQWRDAQTKELHKIQEDNKS